MKALKLVLVILAIFAASAAAQCGGKKIYVELPDGWGNNVYIFWAGSFLNISNTTTKEDRWTVFTLSPTLANGSELILVNYNNFTNASGLMYINAISISSGTVISTTNPFTCASLGEVNYIYEDPAQPGKPILAQQPPDSRIFHFLPPRSGEWIGNVPYFAAAGTFKRMEIDKKCGWYKLTYFNEEPPNSDAVICSNSKCSGDIIGLLGVEDVGWVGLPRTFNLKTMFDALLGADEPGEIYFAADNGVAGWKNTDPNIVQPERCRYSFAAIIYDSDWSVMPCAFKNGEYQMEDFPGCSPKPTVLTASGIAKGIPKPKLKKDENGVSKMEFNQGKDGWTETLFNQAFRSTPGKNVALCYDMPFQRSNEDLWEFDSNKLCANGEIDPEGKCGTTISSSGSPNAGSAPYNGFMGGFFPPELNAENTADYTSCPACKTPHLAEAWVPTFKSGVNAVNKWCFDRGYMSSPAVATSPMSPDGVRCGRAFAEGDFRNGDNPNIWDWSARAIFGTGANIPGRNTSGTTAQMNQLYCFESHAEFTHERGQEFFFSGDDDIWVFINDSLVIDLGGSHLAVPGYVNLDNLLLEEGKKYPIDIFFCDSRTTMSNVRIAANFHFGQNFTKGDGLSIDGDIDSPAGVSLCLQTSDGDCAAVASGAAAAAQKRCGAELAAANITEYYLQKGNTDFVLNSSSENCVASGASITCFGGFTINTSNTNLVFAPNSITGLSQGTYFIYARTTNGSMVTPLRIRGFEVKEGGDINSIRAINYAGVVNFSVQNTSAKTFLARVGNLPAQSNAKIGVYTLSGKLVSQHSIIGNQVNITVPSDGAYVFRLSGKGIAPKSELKLAR